MKSSLVRLSRIQTQLTFTFLVQASGQGTGRRMICDGTWVTQ